MTTWPKDNQTARNAFYGDPGSRVDLEQLFQTAQEKLSVIHNAFSKIPPEVWFLIVGAVAALVWYFSTRAAQASAKDYNIGRLN